MDYKEKAMVIPRKIKTYLKKFPPELEMVLGPCAVLATAAHLKNFVSKDTNLLYGAIVAAEVACIAFFWHGGSRITY